MFFHVHWLTISSCRIPCWRLDPAGWKHSDQTGLRSTLPWRMARRDSDVEKAGLFYDITGAAVLMENVISPIASFSSDSPSPYQTLVLVHLDYCSSVLCSLDASTSRPIQVSLNSCVRFIERLPWASRICEHRRRLGFLTAKDQRRYRAAVLFYKLVST